MTNNQLIEALQKQLAWIDELKLKKYDCPELEGWKAQTADLIRLAVGDKSNLLKRFETLHFRYTGPVFGIGSVGYPTPDVEQQYYMGDLERSRSIITATLDQLKLSESPQLPSAEGESQLSGPPKIFIVHGHDEIAKTQLENLLYRLGTEPIILHRQANKGRTIIEKFEAESDVQYAIVLLTPDDFGARVGFPKDKDSKVRFRARQNVIFELGFFYGKLGRDHVCCLYKKGKQEIELPSDTDGILYIPFGNSVEEAESKIRQELIAAGIKLQEQA